MKNTFPGYYPPDKQEFSDLWADCIFVFDASTILNFYRYSPQTNESFFQCFESLADRLWVPHQAAFEYQENRVSEIITQEEVYADIRDQLKKTEDDLKSLLKKGHLSINVPELLDKVSSTFKDVRALLIDHEKQHPKLLTHDTIRERLTKFFNQKVGAPYTQDRLDEIYEQGEKRYSLHVPPGYLDIVKQDCKVCGNLIIKSAYGDLIIWNQLLDKARETKRGIIFVSDDNKEDWWWKKSGRTIGPRPELAKEVIDNAGVRFYMYTPTAFLEYATKHLGVAVKKHVIDEVRSVTEVRNVAESKMGWKSEVISAFHALGGEVELNELYDHIEQHTSRYLPPSWQTIIRRTVYNHSSDVEAYLGGEDLFTHLGKGQWGLREGLDS